LLKWKKALRKAGFSKGIKKHLIMIYDECFSAKVIGRESAELD
jgi:hypothetical protein